MKHQIEQYPDILQDFKHFFEIVLIEWVATEDENEKVFRVTEKAMKILGNL